MRRNEKYSVGGGGGRWGGGPGTGQPGPAGTGEPQNTDEKIVGVALRRRRRLPRRKEAGAFSGRSASSSGEHFKMLVLPGASALAKGALILLDLEKSSRKTTLTLMAELFKGAVAEFI